MKGMKKTLSKTIGLMAVLCLMAALMPQASMPVNADDMDEGGSKVTREAISPTVTLEDWTYGEEANTPVVTGNTGNGAVSFEYKPSGAADSEYSAEVPTEAGAYVVFAFIDETDNYYAATATADFTIRKAAISPTVTLESWTSGEEANTPEVSGNTGNGAVSFEYKPSGAADSEYSAEVPTEAGAYIVFAFIDETDNYYAATATADFTILAKADPTQTPTQIVTKTPEKTPAKTAAKACSTDKKTSPKTGEGDLAGIWLLLIAAAGIAAALRMRSGYEKN